MGLDSVELLMEFEKFFAVEIPDREAEKMNTVQDAVTGISRYVVFRDHEREIKKNIFNSLESALAEAGVIGILRPDDKIFELLPVTEMEKWDSIAKTMQCKLPKPFLKGAVGKLLNKIFSPPRGYEATSVDRFIDLIAAINYEDVLEKGNIKNKYEVLIGVLGMTIEKLGLNPFEVFPDSSFVDDLGIS